MTLAFENGTPAHQLCIDYLADYSVPEPELLRSLRQETATRFGPKAMMLTGNTEGTFLRFLVTISGAKRVLEFGTFTGYSALSMAAGLPADGKLITCDPSKSVTNLARQYFAKDDKNGPKIEIVNEKGMATLQMLKDRGDAPFDLIFLDSDKPGYAHYTTFLLENDMVKTGGLVVADNVLALGGAPYLRLEEDGNKDHGVHLPFRDGGLAIHHFNTLVRDHPRLEQLLLPIRDGICIARVL